MAEFILVYDSLTGGQLTKPLEAQHIGSGQVGSGKLADTVVVSSHIASGQIGARHWAAGLGTSSQILVARGPTAEPQWGHNPVAINLVYGAGSGQVIASGLKGYLESPFGVVLERCTLLAAESGSIQVDIWKDSYANFPPAAADSIASSVLPRISSVIAYQDLTLTGWNTTVNSGDILAYYSNAASSITQITISLAGRKL